ncbi:MAG: cobalamin B12-binding domain-containing protein [Tepidiformaceae bacterium]
MAERAARVVFASDTSGHTMGYHVVARGLRDAGFEVVMTGRQLPAEAVKTAVEEDADLLAYRIMDRDPVEMVNTLLGGMREAGIGEMPLLVGGIVGKKEAAQLREAGVAGVFGPGSKLTDIVACAREAVAAQA